MTVYASQRTPSKVGYVTLARQICESTLKKLKNENVMSKSVRIYLGRPLVDAVLSLYRNASTAYDIRPSDVSRAILKRNCLLEARADVRNITNMLQLLKDIDSLKTISSVKDILDKLEKERMLLSIQIKNVKVYAKGHNMTVEEENAAITDAIVNGIEDALRASISNSLSALKLSTNMKTDD